MGLHLDTGFDFCDAEFVGVVGDRYLSCWLVFFRGANKLFSGSLAFRVHALVCALFLNFPAVCILR